MEITLTKMGGEVVPNASFGQIKEAYLELYRSKGSGKQHLITLSRFGEEELEIYDQSIVFNDYTRHSYDGPGGPTEEYLGRYEEGTILPALEEVCELFDKGDSKFLDILKSLPKPKS